MTLAGARSVLAAAVVASAPFAAAPARASSGNACADAAFRGQTARDEGKLVEAREAFRACVRQDCPGFVQKDCAGWLDDVERRLPRVVLVAKDAAGRDLVDVKVSADGQTIATKLDGQSVAMNPGKHSFVFEGPGGAKASVEVVLAEGEENRRIVEVVGGEGTKTETTAAPPLHPTNGVKVAGFALGGLGIIGVGVGATFGALAISDKGRANCDADGVCRDGGALSDLRTSSTAATIGFVTGGLLLVSGVALLILAPRPTDASKAVSFAPVVGPDGFGLAIGGPF